MTDAPYLLKTTENMIDADRAWKKLGFICLSEGAKKLQVIAAIILFVDLYPPFCFITIHNMFWSSATRFKTCI